MIDNSILMVYNINYRLIQNLRNAVNEITGSGVGHYFTFVVGKCARYVVILMFIFEFIDYDVMKCPVVIWRYNKYVEYLILSLIFVHKINNWILNEGCFEFGKDSPGNDVAFKWNPPSADGCQKLCQQESRCNFFLFKRRMWWVFNGCWLKSKKASNLRSKSGFVLGPKSCGKY